MFLGIAPKGGDAALLNKWKDGIVLENHTTAKQHLDGKLKAKCQSDFPSASDLDNPEGKLGKCISNADNIRALKLEIMSHAAYKEKFLIE